MKKTSWLSIYITTYILCLIDSVSLILSWDGNKENRVMSLSITTLFRDYFNFLIKREDVDSTVVDYFLLELYDILKNDFVIIFAISGLALIPIFIVKFYKKHKQTFAFGRASLYSATVFIVFFHILTNKFEFDPFLDYIDMLCTSNLQFAASIEIIYRMICMIGFACFLIIDCKAIIIRFIEYLKNSEKTISGKLKIFFVLFCILITAFCQINILFSGLAFPYKYRDIFIDLQEETLFLCINTVHFILLVGLSTAYLAIQRAIGNLRTHKFGILPNVLLCVLFIAETFFFFKEYNLDDSKINIFYYSVTINCVLLCVGTLIYDKKIFHSKRLKDAHSINS